jgi:hypothetical protein
MTVTVAVKVFDGLVLAADSATTLSLEGGGAQVYNSANKIFHLHRNKPIAAATWGLGAIGDASISTLAKDLRRRFMGDDDDHADWELTSGYTVQGVAEKLVEMMFDELYAPLHAGQPDPPSLGFLVAGYSHGERQTEAWRVIIDDPGIRPVPQVEIGTDQSGWGVYAQIEATQRLFNGFDPTLPEKLAAVVPDEHMQAVREVLEGERRLAVPPPMPFVDAINFANFLVEVTTGYTHFLLGPDTVGGPIEVAGISRHEGFKWISRKHYYQSDLNPEDPHHDH